VNNTSSVDSSGRSGRLIWGVAVASVLLPLMLAAVFIWVEWSRGNFPNEAPLAFGGGLHRDQFWHVVQKHSGTLIAPKNSSQFQCLNVKTGEVTDPEIAASFGYFTFCWVGETHYAITRTDIYEIHDKTLNRLPPLPQMESNAFEYNGSLTVITRTKDGNGQLVQWKDRRWVTDREIALPDVDWRFSTDTGVEGQVLRPPANGTSNNLPGTPSANRQLSVAKSGSTYHVHLTASDYSMSAYRMGLDFVDDDSDAISQTKIEPRRLTGWERVNPQQREVHYARMFCDSIGPLFISGGLVVRRENDGSWITLSGLNNLGRDRYFNLVEAVDTQTGEAYLIQMDHLWGERFVMRIDGNTIGPPHVHRPGFRPEYFRRWCLLLGEVLAVWLSHLVILALGLRLNPQRQDLFYGTRRATAAPLWRRCVAFLIDLGLLYACIVLVWVPWRWTFSIPESSWNVVSLDDVLLQLQNLEWRVFYQNFEWRSAYHDILNTPFTWLLLPLDPFTDFLGALSAICLIYIGLSVFCEGMFGCTIGKWIMSVRTMHSTLRPSGLGRCITRRVCVAVDIPFLLSPLPAFISLFWSRNTQRIGDRIADTVVVLAKDL